MEKIRKCFSIRIFLLAMLGLSFGNVAQAQKVYGNEWIVNGQTYYKVFVSKDGFYRIDYNALNTAGLTNQLPTESQIFYRGKQIPILVRDYNNNGKFDSEDYIEFYGRKNDGLLDTILYLKPQYQPNRKVSLYTDTSVYFVTWNKSQLKMRIKEETHTSSSYPVPAWYMASSRLDFADAFWEGRPIEVTHDYQSSEFWQGEGYKSTKIDNGTFKEFQIPTPFMSSGGPNGVLRTTIWGESDNTLNFDHPLRIEVKKQGGTYRTLVDKTYDGFKFFDFNLSLDNTLDIDKGPITFVKISSLDFSGKSNVQSLSFIEIEYPRAFQLSSYSPFFFKYNNSTIDPETHFAFDGFKFSATKLSQIYLYDITHNIRTSSFIPSGEDRPNFAISNKGSADYYMYDSSAISTLNLTGPFTYKGYITGQSDYIIITHPILLPAATDFANYKNGTGFKTTVATVDQLYDYFYYGYHHPVAIQRYLGYMYKKAPASSRPEYLLLIGKGWEYNNLKRGNAGENFHDLVPLYGYPASDMMFTSGIDHDFEGYDSTLDPILKVGRLPATSTTDVYNYLNKLKTYEASGTDIWHKNVIHIGGGDVGDVQDEIKDYLLGLQKMVEGVHTGAKVWSYFNIVDSATNKSAAQRIIPHIDEGAGLFTYFGHGSASVFGVQFGEEKELHNYGKYPIMYLNGCNVGSPGVTGALGPRYINVADKAAVLWLAHSWGTFVNNLAGQMEKFYKNFTVNHYGASVGEIWQETIRDFDKGKITDSLNRNTCMTWIIQGDPSIKFPYQPKPDYAISCDSSFSVFPEDALANMDSFAIRIRVYNKGKANIEDSFTMKIERTYPNGSLKSYVKRYPAIMYGTTIDFYFKNVASINAQGNNSVKVTIDPDNKLVETDKTNNSCIYNFYLNGNGIRQLYPLQYGIIPDFAEANVVLKVQSRNLMDQKTGCYMEIDTTLRFNSPKALHQSNLIPYDGIMTWRPFADPGKKNPDRAFARWVAKKDTVVFYWRARLNAEPGKGDQWETRSFTYIKGSPEGWAQAHWQQYGSISGTDALVDTLPARQILFRKKYTTVILNGNPFYTVGMGITEQNNQTFTAGSCGSTNLFLVTFDKTTLKANIINYPCTTYPRNYLQFDMTKKGKATLPAIGKPQVLNQDDLIACLDSLPDGTFVAIVSKSKIVANGWNNLSKATTDAMSRYLGARKIETLRTTKTLNDSTPYVLMAIKNDGHPVNLGEDFRKIVAPPVGSTPLPSEKVEIKVLIDASRPFGTVTSTLIGPASNWKFEFDKWKSFEKPSTDSTVVYIHGIEKNGRDSILDSGGLNSINLSDPIKYNAQKYPYLKLSARLSDWNSKTSPQLRMWKVLYDGLPEGALVADKNFLFKKDTIQVGDTIKVRLVFKNISKYPMKPVKVTCWINGVTGDTTRYYLTDMPRKALQPDSAFLITYFVTTEKLKPGINRLNVSVNQNFDQPELTLENNVLRVPFTVIGDRTNPILDVTFDGRHIMDGELVSSKPSIIITDKDENKHKLLKDTSVVRIMLKSPGSTVAERIPFNAGELTFTPGTTADNKAKVEYRPRNLADGTYELSVQAWDASRNAAGEKDYTINFEVINKTMVSNFYVYPNPFTTKARFIFTLTGSEIPDYMKVQIMNISGKVVKEIGREELGNLRIGQNITDYYWDGRDEYGDMLANGLYFYRVVVKDHGGKVVERYSTAGDKFFDKNFGKLYILR